MKPTEGIAVDGYCLGNPGQGGYKGVCIKTGKVLFQKNYPFITNNLAEFLGVSHALGFIKRISDEYNVIYTDSQTALSWLKTLNVSTGLNSVKGEKALNDLGRSTRWLSEQKRLVTVEKWITSEWGEIPADFGNKIKKT